MTAYIIAIGGTGAKIVESIIHATAFGLFSTKDKTEDLQILLIDPDTGNGNAIAAKQTFGIYQKSYQIFNTNQDRPWMSSKIESIKSWSIFDNANVKLKDVFGYTNYKSDDPRKHLFDILYTKQEREVDLKEGFRGRPAIGAAIISQWSQESSNTTNWKALIDEIDKDYTTGKEPKVFLCGSIFGGTGASGLPTVGRLLANQLGADGKNLLAKIKLGCLLFLPYFQFSPPRNSQELFARPEEFGLKTEAALRYLGTQNLEFETVYLLGTPTLSAVDKFSSGGSSQYNPSHFLEFYGALALRDFLFTPKPLSYQVVVLSRKQQHSVTWTDIPDGNEVRIKLIAASRFAFAWLSAIVPSLEHARQRPRDVMWLQRFFNNQELRDPDEQNKIDAITDWCENYLQWLGVLHRSVSGVKWLNSDAFLAPDGLLKTDDIREFSNLGPAGIQTSINDILPKLYPRNIEKPNRCTVGLAKALYQKISQER